MAISPSSEFNVLGTYRRKEKNIGLRGGGGAWQIIIANKNSKPRIKQNLEKN